MKDNENTVADFKKGQNVIYVPAHVEDEDWIQSAECEFGIVKDVGKEFVFVRFYSEGTLRRKGVACFPNSLVIQENIEQEKAAHADRVYLRYSKSKIFEVYQ